MLVSKSLKLVVLLDLSVIILTGKKYGLCQTWMFMIAYANMTEIIVLQLVFLCFQIFLTTVNVQIKKRMSGNIKNYFVELSC